MLEGPLQRSGDPQESPIEDLNDSEVAVVRPPVDATGSRGVHRCRLRTLGANLDTLATGS